MKITLVKTNSKSSTIVGKPLKQTFEDLKNGVLSKKDKKAITPQGSKRMQEVKKEFKQQNGTRKRTKRK